MNPDDPLPYISELVERVLAVLEDYDIPIEINNEIVRLIEKWEHSLHLSEEE